MATMLELGPVRARAVLTGRFRLDGGAMFGVVPRVVWDRALPADDRHRVPLALRSLLLEVDERLILVDDGMGTKWPAAEAERFALQPDPGLVAALEAGGQTPADVTDVVLTHLHFDHAGGTTFLDQHRRLALTFPNARHHVQRRNLAHALHPGARDRASYRAENFAPLLGRRELVLHDGPGEIAAGVDLLLFEGHTVGQQLVRVRDPRPGGQWLLYAADLLPTQHHLAPAFTMGYDLKPELTAKEKDRLLFAAAEEGGLLVFEHDPELAAARVARDPSGRYRVVEASRELSWPGRPADRASSP